MKIIVNMEDMKIIRQFGYKNAYYNNVIIIFLLYDLYVQDVNDHGFVQFQIALSNICTLLFPLDLVLLSFYIDSLSRLLCLPLHLQDIGDHKSPQYVILCCSKKCLCPYYPSQTLFYQFTDSLPLPLQYVDKHVSP